jgi:hypothetical protein
MCVDHCSPIWYWPLIFFPLTLTSASQLHTTCLLGPTYQLRTTPRPLLTYLLNPRLLFPLTHLLDSQPLCLPPNQAPVPLHAYLPTYLPISPHTVRSTCTSVMSSSFDEIFANAGIAFDTSLIFLPTYLYATPTQCPHQLMKIMHSIG